MRLKFALAAAFMVSFALSATAKDAYIVRFFDARGQAADCHQAVWSSHTIFYNLNDSPSVLRLVDVSNGPLPANTVTEVALAPHRIFSIDRPNVEGARWTPEANTNLWVLHVDVPEGVVVEHRNEVGDDEICPPFSPKPRVVAKVSMPVFKQLTPPGVPQVTLGTDIVSPMARQNVVVYNGGTREATAQIEIRRGCDDSLVDSRVVRVPARTALQFGGFSVGADSACVTPLNTFPYVRYTTVTVDQPSLSLISTLTERKDPTTGDVIPLIELAVAMNSSF